MEPDNIKLPMEEMAQVAFNKDIQIAMLMKENKELNQKIEMLLRQTQQSSKSQKPAVQAEQG